MRLTRFSHVATLIHGQEKVVETSGWHVSDYRSSLTIKNFPTGGAMVVIVHNTSTPVTISLEHIKLSGLGNNTTVQKSGNTHLLNIDNRVHMNGACIM